MQHMTLISAYGRTYHTREDAMQAWEDGKDFQIVNGPYCSIRDFDVMKRQAVMIILRYGERNLESIMLANSSMPDKLHGII
jgi:hypothetical protein